MAYVVKKQSDGTVGIYDTERASYPIESPELRKAGIARIEGSGRYGWFKGKADEAEAVRICNLLNEFHGYGSSAPMGATDSSGDADMQAMADALMADQAGR